MRPKKTIGVIGLGSIGMRHARNLCDMGHHVCAYDPAVAGRLDGIIICGDPAQVRNSCDAIVIATPSDQHVAEILQVPEHLPVLVEKPIGVCRGDAISLSSLVQRRAAMIYVGNNLRFRGCVKKAKGWLDNGTLGYPLWAEFTVAQYNTKYTDDVITNWGAHELDLANYLLGEAMVCAACGSRDIANITMRHLANGCWTTVHLDYLTEPQLRGFTIAGSKGTVHCELVAQEAYLHSNDPGAYKFSDSYEANYIEEMQAFLDAIDGKPAPLLATAQDGLATLELILKAKELAGINDLRLSRDQP
jgi:predicted dehydrogenase